MTSILLKNLSNKICFANIVTRILPITPNVNLKVGFHTQNEKDWIKQNNIKLRELAKNTKGPNINFDPKEPQPFFENCEELKDANETVKKLLSLEYASRHDVRRKEEEFLNKIFRNTPVNENSLEVKIAIHTMNIIRMNKHLEEAKKANGRNRRVEFFLYRQIHRRDRFLLQLYYKDNSRYEWLIEQLNMKDYKLVEGYPYKRVTRLEKHIKEVKSANRLKRLEKLEEMKKKFDAEKALFFKEKDQALLEIQKELQDLGLGTIQIPNKA